jgi:hypothetical protein
VRIASLQKRYRALWKIALRALALWAIVATVGAIGLFIQGENNTSASERAANASERAARASEKAATAESRANAAIRLLGQEAAGSCFRVNYLRWNVDRQRYADWRRDVRAAHFLRTLPAATARSNALAASFAASAAAARFLPLTDCHKADSMPTTYQPPTAIPFGSVSPRVLHQVLTHPPKPPAFQ